MNEPNPNRLPIPQLFWSEYLEGPFENCIDCGCPLPEADHYLIQRSFVGTEPVFEFAICKRCHEALGGQCSEETSQAVTSFMMSALSDRMLELQQDVTAEEILEKSVNECIVCSKSRSECHRYGLAGISMGSELVVEMSLFARSPLMICHDCELQMSELVSKKTRDTWDRFVEENFDGPPGVGLDLPHGAPMLI